MQLNVCKAGNGHLYFRNLIKGCSYGCYLDTAYEFKPLQFFILSFCLWHMEKNTETYSNSPKEEIHKLKRRL